MPKALFDGVWQKAPFGLTGDFETDPFSLFGDSPQGVRAPFARRAAGDLTAARHDSLLREFEIFEICIMPQKAQILKFDLSQDSR